MGNGVAGAVRTPMDTDSTHRRIRIAARAEPAQGASWPCQIVSFSVEGLRVRYPVSREDTISRCFAKGDCSLHLGFRSRGSDRLCYMRVRMMRYASGILEAQFDEQPLHCFEMLLEAAGLARREPAESAGVPQTDPRIIVSQCAGTWVDSLEPLFRRSLGALPRLLTRHAREAGSAQEAESLREAAGQLLKQRDRIWQSVARSLRAGFDEGAGCLPACSDWLGVRVMAARAGQRYEATLALLHWRLEALGRDDLSGEQGPLTPQRLCAVFAAALEQEGFSRRINRRIYPVFEQAVLLALGRVYSQLHEVFLRHDPRRGGPQRYRLTECASPARYKSPDQRLQEARVATRKAVVPALPSLMEPDDVRPESLTSEGHFVTARKLWVCLGMLEGELVSDSDAALIVPAQVHSSLRRLRQAESSVQAQSLQKRLAAWFDSGQQAIPGELTVAAGLVERLVQSLCESPRLSQRGRWCLRRLETTLLETAVSEPQILDRTDHPLRRIIDLIGHLDTADHQETRDWPRDLYHRIERIARGQSGHRELEATVTTLQGLLESREEHHQRKLRPALKAAEGSEKLAEASRITDDALDDRLLGRAVPAPVLQLVEHGWRDLMALSYLRNAGQEGEWSECLALLDELLAMSEKGPAPDPDALIERVRSGLGEIALAQPDEVLRALQAYLHAPEQSRSVRLSEGFCKREREHEAPATGEHRLWRLRLEQMTPGAWFLDESNADAPAPVRLAWCNERRSEFLLVSPSGKKVAQYNAGEMADHLVTQKLMPIARQDLRLFNEATRRLIEQLQTQLTESVNTDPVTGLPVAREYTRRLGRFLTMAHQGSEQALAVVELAPSVHSARCLQRVAALLDEQLPPEGLAGVLDSGLFAVLLPAEGVDVWLNWLMGQLNRILAQPHGAGVIRGGVAMGDPGIVTTRHWLDLARDACRGAPFQPSPTFRYGAVSAERARYVLRLADRLAGHHELDHEALLLKAHRIIPLHAQTRMAGQHEISLSMHNERGELVNAAELIPLAERYHRIRALDRWVIAQMLEHTTQMGSLMPEQGGGIGINVSGHSLNDPELLEFIYHLLSQRHHAIEKLWFRIDEAHAIADPDGVASFIQEVRELGCRICLGGMGTDPDLARLMQRLPVDMIALDGALVAGLQHSRKDRLLLEATVSLAHRMGCELVASEVQERPVLDILREAGVDYAKGYAIAKPWLVNR